MALIVEIDLFSGLPNPTYSIEPRAEQVCRQQLTHLQRTHQLGILSDVRTHPGTVPDGERNAVGYGGLRLHLVDTSPFRTQSFSLGDGLGIGPEGEFSDPDRALERLLLSWATPEARDKALVPFEAFFSRDAADKPIRNIENLGQPSECANALRFPGMRNIWNTKRFLNSCFNYALNLPCSDWRIPGDVTGPAQPAELIRLTSKEGLTFLEAGFGRVCPLNSYLVLLCLIDPASSGSGSCHFLRLDVNGWSHKNGTDTIKNHDGAGQAMTDLATMRFRYQLVACGVFLVRSGLIC